VLRDVRILGRASNCGWSSPTLSCILLNPAHRGGGRLIYRGRHRRRHALNAMWQRLLPFCSHKTPNQDQTGRRTTHHEKTSKCPHSNVFSTRSEGYRSWPLRTHNPKVAGSDPAPATMNDEGLADVEAASPFRLPRLHPGIGLLARLSLSVEMSNAHGNLPVGGGAALSFHQRTAVQICPPQPNEPRGYD
jgi:hypothetical protein